MEELLLSATECTWY